MVCVWAWESPAARGGATGLGGRGGLVGAERLRRFWSAGVDVPADGDAVGPVRVGDAVAVFGGRLLIADGD